MAVKRLAKQSLFGKKKQLKTSNENFYYTTAREFNLDPTICALSGGEDYELLFTVKQADYDKIKFKLDITIIGYITEPAAGCNLVTKAGNVHALKAQGWNAFGG